MPLRINGNVPGVRQFAAHADTAQGLSNRVLFRNGHLERASGLSAFFAGSQARRATVEAFRRSIVREYGQTVGAALSPRLDTLCARGKSLKASVVRDMLREAGETKAHLAQINRATVHSFCNGGIPGRGMDDALEAFYAAHPMSPAQRDDMRGLVRAQLQTFTARNDQSLCNPFRLYDEISQGRLSCMEDIRAAWGDMPESSFYPYRQMIRREGGHAADIAWLANFADRNGFTLSLMAEKLPEMRGLQPEGPISLATVWRACFGEEAPQAVLDKGPEAAGKAFFSRAERMVADALTRAGSLDPGTEMQVKLSVSNGVKLQRAVELCANPGRITLADVVGQPPSLYDIGTGVTPGKAEEAIARDLNRWGTQGGFAGYEPVMAFAFPDGPREHRIQDLSGLGEKERAAYSSGQPSPKSRALMDSVRELCGEDNVAQQAVVGFGLSQAGLCLIRNLSSLTGVPRDEHSPCDITLSRDGAGNVTLRYATPPESPLDFRAEYVVRPDGTSELTALDMGPRAAAQDA